MEQAQGKGAGWDAERVSISRHFVRDMEQLWNEILRMVAVVESTLNLTVQALCDGRADLAAEIRSSEYEVDRLDIDIERDCLKILALHQPVASDLRRVAAILRIDRELERIADLSRHIAKRTRKLAREVVPLPIPSELEALAHDVLSQVRGCLDALTRADADIARTIIAADSAIDARRRAVLKQLKEAVREAPDRLNNYLRLMHNTRNLERIADHATHIAGAVIYMKEGDIVRHFLDDQGH
jgi:phosphate transport system protein